MSVVYPELQNVAITVYCPFRPPVQLLILDLMLMCFYCCGCRYMLLFSVYV